MNLPAWCVTCRGLPDDVLFFFAINSWGVAYRESYVVR